MFHFTYVIYLSCLPLSFLYDGNCLSAFGTFPDFIVLYPVPLHFTMVCQEKKSLSDISPSLKLFPGSSLLTWSILFFYIFYYICYFMAPVSHQSHSYTASNIFTLYPVFCFLHCQIKWNKAWKWHTYEFMVLRNRSK